MRTTFRISDDLYLEVKVAAARSGSTVTSFVEGALRAALARAGTDDGDLAQPYRVRPTGRGGTVPGVDLTDSSDLLDRMESV